MRSVISILLVFILFSPFHKLFCQTNGISITPELSGKELGKYIEIFEDKDGNLSIEDIISPGVQQQFMPSGQEVPGFGFSSSAYWVKLKVLNPDEQEIKWYLEIGYPLLDDIKLYVPDSAVGFTVRNAGDHFEFNNREVDYRNFLFNLKEDANSQKTYYLRFKSSSSMNFPLNYWDHETFLKKIISEQIILGSYYGAILIMIIYGLFLFIGFRDPSFVYYVLLLLSWGAAQFAINGLAFQYLWPNWVWWANVNIPFFIFTAAILMVQLTRSFLLTDKHLPLWDKILFIDILIIGTGVIFSLILPYELSIKLAAAIALITVLLLSFVGISIALKKGYRAAYFFIAAFGLYFIGIILFALKSFGILPNNFITIWGVQIGAFALLVLLSVAVQDRIKREKKEKYLAQKSALENQQMLVETLKQSEQLLEKKVSERTEELSQKNELLNERAKELASINRLAEKVSSSLNILEVLQAVCDELIKIFHVRNAGIGLLDAAKTKLKIVVFRSSLPDEKDATGMELPLPDNEASQIVIRTKQPIAIENAQTDPRTKSIHDIMKMRGTTGLLIVPILSRSEVLGTIGMPAKDINQKFKDTDIELAKTIAAQVASSVDNAQLYTRTEQALDVVEQDLEIGRQIQTGFLPKTLPQTPDWEVSSYFVAARKVAGDFYDAFRLGSEGKIGLVVADVCDKGVGAALFMVVFRSLIRAFSEERQTNNNSEDFLLSIVSTVNKYITTIHDSSNMFATVFFGILTPKDNALYYINAGHDMPVIIDGKGNIKQLLEPTGPAIGLTPEMTFSVGKVHLQKGDIMVAYTDGVIDARNVAGEPFSEESLITYLKKPYASAFSLLKYIEDKINRHILDSDQFDDITMLAIRHRINKNDNKHEFTQQAFMSNLPLLKGFIEQAGVHMNLSEDFRFAFKTAVDEACTNIITHGYQDREPGPIKLVFESNSEKVKLSIYDEGIYFHPQEAKEVDVASDWDERQIGGLGLFLIKELIDEIKYEINEAGGNLLVLTKNIN